MFISRSSDWENKPTKVISSQYRPQQKQKKREENSEAMAIELAHDDVAWLLLLVFAHRIKAASRTGFFSWFYAPSMHNTHTRTERERERKKRVLFMLLALCKDKLWCIVAAVLLLHVLDQVLILIIFAFIPLLIQKWFN